MANGTGGTLNSNKTKTFRCGQQYITILFSVSLAVMIHVVNAWGTA